MQSAPFDAGYFERYYESTSTRVYGEKEIARLARGVIGLIQWLGGNVETVLDVGAGTGLWKRWLEKHRPDVRYRSIDVSAYACERYGHEQLDIATWRGPESYDLVVCQGVLPYLDDARCERAIENVAAMAHGFVFVEAITERDLREVCDLRSTDSAVHARSGTWYRERLGKYFLTVGGGLFYVRGGGVHFYELELGSSGNP